MESGERCIWWEMGRTGGSWDGSLNNWWNLARRVERAKGVGRLSETKFGEAIWEEEGAGPKWNRAKTAWVCNMRLSWWVEAEGGLTGMFTTR